MAWKLYTDAGLTIEFGGTLTFTHYTDLSDGSQDGVLYYAEKELDPADNGSYKMILPGGGDILLSLADASPGSGHETTEIKLATSAVDLDTAIAGDPLNLGSELISGASSVTEVHIRVTNTVTTIGNSVELSVGKLETNVRAV